MEYKEQFKIKIEKFINDSTGIKKMELIPHVIERTPECTTELITDCIEELVKEGKIMEIEYEVPPRIKPYISLLRNKEIKMNYRTKSMFFPANTTLRIINVRIIKSEEQK